MILSVCPSFRKALNDVTGIRVQAVATAGPLPQWGGSRGRGLGWGFKIGGFGDARSQKAWRQRPLIVSEEGHLPGKTEERGEKIQMDFLDSTEKRRPWICKEQTETGNPKHKKRAAIPVSWTALALLTRPATRGPSLSPALTRVAVSWCHF